MNDDEHRCEDETFYVVEGQCGILPGEEWITAGVGDFVSVPRGTVHRFENQGTEAMRRILTFTPAGIEKFFVETLPIAPRYAAAAPRYGKGAVACASS
jgi:quercetin dioxygenase-like cupin family protein